MKHQTKFWNYVVLCIVIAITIEFVLIKLFLSISHVIKLVDENPLKSASKRNWECRSFFNYSVLNNYSIQSLITNVIILIYIDRIIGPLLIEISIQIRSLGMYRQWPRNKIHKHNFYICNSPEWLLWFENISMLTNSILMDGFNWFSIEIYTQIYTYYCRNAVYGLLGSTRINIWWSITFAYTLYT